MNKEKQKNVLHYNIRDYGGTCHHDIYLNEVHIYSLETDRDRYHKADDEVLDFVNKIITDEIIFISKNIYLLRWLKYNYESLKTKGMEHIIRALCRSLTEQLKKNAKKWRLAEALMEKNK